jgi:hypothetical protein
MKLIKWLGAWINYLVWKLHSIMVLMFVFPLVVLASYGVDEPEFMTRHGGPSVVKNRFGEWLDYYWRWYPPPTWPRKDLTKPSK